MHFVVQLTYKGRAASGLFIELWLKEGWMCVWVEGGVIQIDATALM